jgi:hypothetical protein
MWRLLGELGSGMAEAGKTEQSEQPNNTVAGPRSAGPEIDATVGAVVAQVGRLLAQNFGALLTPVTVIAVLLWVPGIALVLMALDGQAVIRNGAVQPVAPRPGLLITSLVVIFAQVILHLILVAMVAVSTVDALLGRPVSTGRALRASLKRSGQLLMLLALVGAAVSTLIVLTAFTPLTGPQWTLAVLAFTLVALAACWLLLAVPIVVLYEAGPLQALGRLWRTTRRRRTLMFWHVLATAIVVPVALGAIGRLLASLLPGISESIAETAITTVLGVLTLAWQGIAVTVVNLNQRYPFSVRWRDAPPDTLSLADLTTRRAGTPSPRKRRPGRAAALTVFLMAAPGVLYGGYLYTNPQSPSGCWCSPP